MLIIQNVLKYHGTIVAGMIAAAQNGKYTSGISPNVTLLPISHNLESSEPYLKSWQLVFRGHGEMEHISLIIHGAIEQEFIMMYCIVLYLKRLYMMQ